MQQGQSLLILVTFTFSISLGDALVCHIIGNLKVLKNILISGCHPVRRSNFFGHLFFDKREV